MKKSAIALIVAMLCMLGEMPIRADLIMGQSDPFRVDTRCGEFVIEDVKSAFCHGAYGVRGGKKATFLSGISAKIDFTVSVQGSGVELKRVEVQGVMHEGATFSLDVGALGVGEIVQVVAYGEAGGANVVSLPFRVNCDVASVPFPGWLKGQQEALMQYAKDLAAGKSEWAATALSIEWEKIETTRKPWWLPPLKTTIAPSLEMSAKYYMQNGTCLITAGNIGQNWMGGKMLRRSNGQFLKWGNTSWGWNAHGELKMSWNEKLREWNWESAGIAGEVEGELKNIAFNTLWGPVPVFAGPVLKGEVKPAVRVYGLSQMSDLELSVSSRHFPTVGGRAGLGWYPLAALYGMLTGSGELEGRLGGPKGSDLSFGLYASVGGGVALLGMTPEIMLDSGTYWLFGEKAQDKESSLTKGNQMPQIKWVPMGREYLKRTKGKRASEFETGGYPNPEPVVGQGGGRDFVGFLRDDGTRGDADRTALVVQSGMPGSWEMAEEVWDDGTADWMPSLAVAGDGTAVMAWANEKRAWGADVPEFVEVCTGLELAVAVRDVNTGIWNARNLTDDEAMDAGPVVRAAGDGTAMVAWIKNASGMPFGDIAGTTDVMAVRWNGSKWGVPVVVAEETGALSGLDLEYDGTNACMVWAANEDGDWESTGNMKVSAAEWNDEGWGEPVEMARGVERAAPVVAQILHDGGESYGWCVWGENGVLMERGMEWPEGYSLAARVAWNGEVPSDAKVVHGADRTVALVWAEGSEEGKWISNPVVMMYDPSMWAWGGPVMMGESEEGRVTRGMSASVSADGVLAVWESVAILTNATGNLAFGETELREASVETFMAYPDVQVSEIAFATNEVVLGELTGVKVTVRNMGLMGAWGQLRVWVCDGELEEDEQAQFELFEDGGSAMYLNLPGGGEVEKTVWWVAGSFRTNLTFVAQVVGYDEKIWRPEITALQLENAHCDAITTAMRLLTATVRNQGVMTAAEGTEVSFRLGAPDGQEVGRDTAGLLAPGEDQGYDAGIAWDMTGGSWTGAWVTVYAVIDTGDTEADVSSAVPIRVMTPRDRDGDGLLDGEEEAMGTNPLKADTNGDGVNDYEHVYVYFSNPLEGMDATYTMSTPVPVPYTWLDQYATALEAHGGNYEALAIDTAANGQPVWLCYLMGVNPMDERAMFKAYFRIEDGQWQIKWTPDLNEAGTKTNRVYHVEGKKEMMDENWEDLTGVEDLEKEGWRFFRVGVELPPE